MTKTPQRSQPHVTAFDGLRALAALAVLFMHAVDFGAPLLTSASLDRVINRAALSGWIGVDLFFVLSGYLITGILLQSRGQPGYFRSFYARRTVRIFPLYYGVLALVVIVGPLAAPYLLGHAASSQSTNGQFWEWTYLANWRVAWVGNWAALPAHTVHFWSLAVEEQFYLCWPLLVFWLGERGTRRLSIALLVAAPLLRAWLISRGVPSIALYTTTPTRIDGLAAGALVACLVATCNSAGGARGGLQALRPLAQRAGVAALVVLVGVVATVGFLDQYHPVVQIAGYSALAVGFAAVVVLADTQHWLTHPWLTYLGRRSYALYILHPFVLDVVVHTPLLRHIPRIAGSSALQQVALFVAGTLLTVVLAELTWRLWESPWLSLKRYFPRPTPSGLEAS